jgi:hypothetical protein
MSVSEDWIIYFFLFNKYISPAQINAYNQEKPTAKIHNLVNVIRMFF